MAEDDPKTLVSTGWLERHLKDPDLRLLDASWYMPGSGRDPKAEYDAAHIPGAYFLHLDEDLSGEKTGTNGRHPLPDLAAFAAKIARC